MRPAPALYDMAAAVAADPWAPIHSRTEAACHLHWRLWGLPCWLPDDRAVQLAYARQQARGAA